MDEQAHYQVSKEPYIVSKEPYKVSKEPYKVSKEPYQVSQEANLWMSDEQVQFYAGQQLPPGQRLRCTCLSFFLFCQKTSNPDIISIFQ